MKNSQPLRYDSAENVKIEKLTITPRTEVAAYFDRCKNVHIKNLVIENGRNDKGGIYLEKCDNVTIENVTFRNLTSAIIVSQSTNLYIVNNKCINMQGGGNKLGQFVQLRECVGGNIKIHKNLIQNITGQSYPEDAINLYKSSGAKESPIHVAYNKILGGGPSDTGGGIALGDEGGAYQLAEENILVNPGQYGIGIAGGHDMTIRGNIIVGEKKIYSNVGISAWNQYPFPCYNITIENNQVNWVNRDGGRNDFWADINVGIIKGLESNSFGKVGLGRGVLPSRLV